MFKRLLSFFILAVFVLAACKPDEKPTPGPTPQPVDPQEPATVTLSDVTTSSDAIKYDTSSDKLTINFTDAGGSASFKLKASNSWTIKAANNHADSWISVSPASGNKGEATVKVSADANGTYDDRSADFEIACGSVKKTVRAVQKQKDAILISDNKAEISAEGGELKIELQHNIDYTVEISEGADWIKKVETKGLSKVILSFEVEPNEGTKTREGSITVSSSAGSETVSVCQAGALPYIVIGQKEYNVDSDEHQIEVLVTSNTSISVRVEGSDWLLYEQTKASSTDRYVFRVKANTSYDSRTGRIVFFAGNGLEDEVVINQSALGALIIATDTYEIPSEGGDYALELSTNFDYYDVSTNAFWISIIETKGLNKHTIRFFVDSYTSVYERRGSIDIYAEDKMQSVTIIQKGKVQDYSVILGSELFEPLSNATKEKITECYFFVNSDKTTSLEVPTNGRLGYPAYLELQGTVLNCYMKGSYYDVYDSMEMFKGWKSLKTVKFNGLDFSNNYRTSRMFSGCTSYESRVLYIFFKNSAIRPFNSCEPQFYAF